MMPNEIKSAIEKKEAEIRNELKDFQLATVERVGNQFRKGYNRILVADEVGLGKTLIARGTIVEMARIRVLEENNNNFKVVYICSNQNIANQNIDKLDVFKCGTSHIGSRLSEVHFGLAEKKANKCSNNFVEMIPLTPTTSFKVTRGQGTRWERALMYVILRRLPSLDKMQTELSELLRFGVSREYWNRDVSLREEAVGKLELITGLNYPQSVLDSISESHLDKIIQLKEYLNNNSKERAVTIIGILRMMFAEISVGELNPDLVIMDEFQRFKFLIDNKDSEANILSRRFLSNKYDNDPDKRLRVLLLSATPYKLFSTLDEMEDNPDHLDEHYNEFFKVMHFLEDGGPKTTSFDDVWNEYSKQLCGLRKERAEICSVINNKEIAEDIMYQSMCRTERLSVLHSEDFIDDSSKRKHIKVNSYDIKQFLEISESLQEYKINKTIPVDYVKSCPYLLSFMHNYEAKRLINEYLKNNPEQIDLIGKKKELWIDKSIINKYKELDSSNSKLNLLQEHCFIGNSENFLWIPPTLPYYKLKGVYEGSEEIGYSKILLFSAWEMVPRMIASLISYEAERRTVAKLCELKSKPCHYNVNSKKRYPSQRLTFKTRKVNKDNEAMASMALFTLFYPSKYLSEIYSPSEYINKNIKDLTFIENDIKKKIKKTLTPIIKKYGKQKGPGDAWYYMAPILLDLAEYPEYTSEWLESEHLNTQTNTAYAKHVDELESIIADIENIKLGRVPKDLVDKLCDISLGGIATCINRTIHNTGLNSSEATRLAKSFIDRFDTPESISIIELSTRINENEDTHWGNVLSYSKNGCFQAMFDEYFNLVYNEKRQDCQKAKEQILDDIDIGTISNKVEGYRNYKNRIEKNKDDKDEKTYMRTHFAMGFSGGAGSPDEKKVKSKDNIRHAFNSPLRPFVLASTSIGQEGLDFHLYCRKIMHWNLPSNPIDLEQREGRINRYKCLAIRQNIARDYKSKIHFNNNIWDELFDTAQNDKKPGEPDLIPFWCYNKPDGIKIERILPLYPLSSDISKYERLIKILSAYRLTLGQARQEELLESVFRNYSDISELEGLFFNLCPFSKRKK